MNRYQPGARVEVHDGERWNPGTLSSLDRVERQQHIERYRGFGLDWARAMHVDLDDGRQLTFIDPQLSDRIRLVAGRSYLRAVP